jgi:hypothetical protein
MKIKHVLFAVLCTSALAFAPLTMAGHCHKTHWHSCYKTLKVNPCQLSKYPLRVVTATDVNRCRVSLTPGSHHYVGVVNVYKNGMKLKRYASCAELDVGNPVKHIHRYTSSHGVKYYDFYICKPIVPRA